MKLESTYIDINEEVPNEVTIPSHVGSTLLDVHATDGRLHFSYLSNENRPKTKMKIKILQDGDEVSANMVHAASFVVNSVNYYVFSEKNK